MIRLTINFIYLTKSLFSVFFHSLQSAAILATFIVIPIGFIFNEPTTLIVLWIVIFLCTFFSCARENIEFIVSKQAKLANLESSLSSQTPLFGYWLQLGAVDMLVRDSSSEALNILINAFSTNQKIKVLDNILNHLERISNQTCIDVICAGWSKNRHKGLADLLVKKGWVASAPVDIRVLSALKTKQFQIITNGEEEIVKPLLNAFNDCDSEIANQASKCAVSLNNSKAKEVICRLVIKEDNPIARQVALTAEYLPKDPIQKTLFYFVTEQWDKYESLDFDQTLLLKAHELADEQIRQRIAEKLRQAGRVEWLKVIAGGNQIKRLGAMTNAEWETTLAILYHSQQWEKMWQLAQKAPAIRSKQLLQKLKIVAYCPTLKEEHEAFERLEKLADKCLENIPITGNRISCQKTLSDGNVGVEEISFSPDGNLLATCKYSRIKLWQMPDGQLLSTETAGFLIEKIIFSPDGNLLASCGSDKTIILWEVKPKLKLLNTLIGHTDWVNGISFSPDGQLLASCSRDKTIILWQIKPELKRLNTLTGGHTDWVDRISFSPDGQLLASGGNFEKTIILWQIKPELKLLDSITDTDWHNEITFSPNGQLLASCSRDKTIILWQIKPELKRLNTLIGHTDWVRKISFSPDGKLLASCSDDNTTKLWQTPSDKQLANFANYTFEVSANRVCFSPDGQFLAICDYQSTRLWSSKIFQLSRLPIKSLCQQNRESIQKTLREKTITEQERNWLEFMQALMDWYQHWHQRFDVEVEDAPQSINAGEFDIEIEG